MINAVHILRDGRTVVVREAVPEDAEQLIDLVQNILSSTTYTLTMVDEFDATIESQEQWIEQYSNNRTWMALVAEIDGQLVGNLDFRNHTKKRNCHIGEFGMGVRDTFRGQGIGSAILAEFLTWVKDAPVIQKVNLSVMSINEKAVKLYQSLGFIEQGRHPKAIRMDNNEYAEVIEMYLFV